MKKKSKSLAEVVRTHLGQKPYLMYAIENGIVNYSALAKKLKPKIAEALGRKVSMDAIAISIRRYAETLSKEASVQEAQLLKLLSKAQISMKNNIVDITFKKGELKVEGFKPIHTSSGSNADTLIINNEDLPKVDMVNAIKIRKNLVEIAIITPADVESIPGFVEYTTGLLASNSINIVEVMSCYTDTIFIVEEKDAMKAYEILKQKTS